jgi:L-rhamnose isomerase
VEVIFLSFSLSLPFYFYKRQLPSHIVLNDLGHHALGANIEQIVAILLSERKLGGFHFNDKKYGDDDLTVGAINPYQLFLIYCELVAGELDPDYTNEVKNLSLMIDENHNIKNQIEGWRRRSRDLRWSVKVHRLITHTYKFNDEAVEIWRRFKNLFQPLSPSIDFFLFL